MAEKELGAAVKKLEKDSVYWDSLQFFLTALRGRRHCVCARLAPEAFCRRWRSADQDFI